MALKRRATSSLLRPHRAQFLSFWVILISLIFLYIFGFCVTFSSNENIKRQALPLNRGRDPPAQESPSCHRALFQGFLPKGSGCQVTEVSKLSHLVFLEDSCLITSSQGRIKLPSRAPCHGPWAGPHVTKGREVLVRARRTVNNSGLNGPWVSPISYIVASTGADHL